MNIVSVDGYSEKENDFSLGLSEHTHMSWEVYSLVSNYKQKSQWIELKRYLRYVQAGWHLFINRNDIQNLVAWQQFHGVFFSFFSHLFRVNKTTSLIIMTFIYKRKAGLAGALYEWFMKFSLSDRYVDHIICYSEDEIKMYSELFDISISKFSYVKVAANPIKNIDYNYKEPKYIFSAGYSHRDFNFLIDAIKDTDYHLVIADDRIDEPHLPNVTIKRGCYGDDMLRELGNSYVFINPLKDKTISAGQLMTISAMQLHKPTISTISDGMKPYLIDGVTGFFVEKSKDDLLEKLDLLFNDEALYKKMCDAAFKYGESQFSWKRLAKDVYKIAKDNNIF
jgi:glycosyltransferase involved in cell wall biosynthesis